MKATRHNGEIPCHKDQPKYTFVSRVGYVFLLLCFVFITAGYLSWRVWNFFFGLIFSGHGDVYTAEELAFKPLLNMTMYAMPYGFFFLAIGCFIVCLFVYGHLSLMNVSAWWERRQEKKHAR